MILTALPALPSQTKSSIQQNIAQILQLHEDLLSELQEAIPQADLTRSAQQEAYPVTKAKHIRFHSADIIPGRLGEHRATRRLRHSLEIGRSPDRRPQGLVIDTKAVNSIARIFNRHVSINTATSLNMLTQQDETLLYLRRVRRALDYDVLGAYHYVQRFAWLAGIRARSRSVAENHCLGEQSRVW